MGNQSMFVFIEQEELELYNTHNCIDGSKQGCNVRKVYCSCVYSVYIMKQVLSGRNL